MNISGDLWQGFVRWRQNQRALKRGTGTVGPAYLPEGPADTHNESSLSKMQRDLKRVDERSAHHLALPAKKERLVMGKLKLIGLILLFLLAGFLFFVAGFLTCYTVLPPSHTSYSAHVPEGGPYGVSRLSQGLGTTASSHRASPGESYAARQSLLQTARRGQGRPTSGGGFNDALHKAEEKTAHQAKLQAHNFITRTLNRWSMKLRSMFGYYAGSAIAPLTTGLAKQVADSALPVNKPGFGLGLSSLRPSSGGSAGPNTAANTPASSGSAGTPSGQGASSTGQAPDVGDIPPSASAPGLYTILVQSFSGSGEAFQLSNALQSNGFGAYVDQEQSGSGVKFSVKVGQFSNFTDARNAAAVLSQQWHQPARVMVIQAPPGPS